MSDVERRLLGRLVTAEAISEAWNLGVRPEQFEEPWYQAIFNWTVQYWHQSRMQSAPTAWVLAEEFTGYKPAENIEEEVFELVALLRRRYITNQLQEMLRLAAADSKISPEDALKNLYTQAYSVSEIVNPRVTGVNMADNVEERRAWAGRNDEPQAGTAPFGIAMLDEFTGRIRPGELAVIGAFAKTGKTMMLCNAAVAAVKQGLRPVVFTLEVSLQDLQQRIDAFFSKVSYNNLLHDRLSEAWKEVLYVSQEELRRLGGIYVERPEPGDRTVASLIARTRQLGANYLIIDQLSRLEPGRRTFNTKETRAVVLDQLHNEISRGGSELPCFMAVQMRRGDDAPTLESFADSAEVEREVDFALAIYRNAQVRANAQMRCDILGSRRSDITNFMLNWDLTHQTEITGLRELRGAP